MKCEHCSHAFILDHTRISPMNPAMRATLVELLILDPTEFCGHRSVLPFHPVVSLERIIFGHVEFSVADSGQCQAHLHEGLPSAADHLLTGVVVGSRSEGVCLLLAL